MSEFHKVITQDTLTKIRVIKLRTGMTQKEIISEAIQRYYNSFNFDPDAVNHFVDVTTGVPKGE